MNAAVGTRDFVLGRNCRFMQGPQTDRVKVKEMRRALDDTSLRPFTVSSVFSQARLALRA